MRHPNAIDYAIVRTGLKNQKLRDVPILSSVYGWMNGSSSPLFTPLEWEEVAKVVNDNDVEVELPVSPADPNARYIGEIFQRLKSRALIVAVGYSALHQTLETTEGEVGIVTGVRGVNIAGRLPNGLEDLAVRGVGSKKIYTAALRKGVNDLPAGIVSITGNLATAPNGQRMLGHNVPIDRLAYASDSSELKLF